MGYLCALALEQECRAVGAVCGRVERLGGGSGWNSFAAPSRAPGKGLRYLIFDLAVEKREGGGGGFRVLEETLPASFSFSYLPQALKAMQCVPLRVHLGMSLCRISKDLCYTKFLPISLIFFQLLVILFS